MNTFSRGIHPESNKDATKKSTISTMPAPKMVYIPVLQHIGQAAEIIVSEGDEVKIGQVLAKKSADISANVLSSVSGKIIKIENRITSLANCKHIVIENDGENTCVEFQPLTSPTSEQIIARIKDAGIVGMGGAGFPTDVKLSPKESIDTLIINGAECEPYITCDYRIMLDYTEQFLNGALLLATALNVSDITVAIEENKLDAKERLDFVIGKSGLNIKTLAVKTKYPQGAEKQIIYAVTGKRVGNGKLPSTVGVIVSNVHTALSTYLAVNFGKPCVSRVMTVTGGGIKNPCNIWVANGTLYSDIIEFCGSYSDKNTVKLINGGPMMGTSVQTDLIASTKTTSCLLLMTDEEAFRGNPSACINCCKCAKVCPMRLMPMFIDANILCGNVEEAVKYGAVNCIECGCCSFICPAKRPLVQSIRLAKRKGKQLLKNK